MEKENPLAYAAPHGGLCAVFQTVGVIGDSLASGEFESETNDGTKGFHDYYYYSWGQFMARRCGFTAYNFSRGGMTAECFLREFGAQCGFYDTSKVCQAYYVALGVNDLFGQRLNLGTVEDFNGENPENSIKSFAGYFGRILFDIKKMQPKARIFLVTMPRKGEKERDERSAGHAALMHEFAKRFDFTYVIDLYTYAPVYDADFQKQYYLGGHMNAAGYLLTADYILSYTDFLIRTHMEDFSQIGFVGTPFHNAKAKW